MWPGVQLAEILSPLTNVSLLGENTDKYLALSDTKISLVTAGFTIYNFVNSSLKIGIGYQRKCLNRFTISGCKPIG